MQNVISIIATQSKAINTPKDTKGDESSKSKDNSKDFVTILFDQIKNSIKTSVDDSDKLSSKVKINLDSLLKNDKKKSTDEILLNEILSILSTLKNSDDSVSFPKFSDKLEKILSNKSILNEFKDAKNIGDLLKLSKKYNLGLKNIKFTKEKIETLQKEFPKLKLKSFFENRDTKETKTTNLGTKTVKSEKTIIIEKLIKNLPNKTNKTEVNPKNILQTLLKNIDEDTKKVIIKTTEEDKKDKVHEFITKDEKVDKKIDIKNSKTPKIMVKQTQKDSNQITSSKQNITKHLKTDDLNKKDVVVTSKIKILNKKITLDKHKNIKDAVDKTQQSIVAKKTAETILQTKQKIKDLTLNSTKIERNIDSNNIQNISTKLDNKSDSKKEISEIKHNPFTHKTEIKTIITKETFKTNHETNTKHSLNQFANNLKEKIQNYKPPLMKLQMTLTPKNLGEVEVTLLNRGNNLHVNITSNTNTMLLFTQNQTEFKNSLVNMGFTNLEMNFSDQGKGNQQNQNNRQNNNSSFEEAQNQENYESTIELVVPQYV